MYSGSSLCFMYGWNESEFRQNIISIKLIEVFPVCTVIFSLSFRLKVDEFTNHLETERETYLLPHSIQQEYVNKHRTYVSNLLDTHFLREHNFFTETTSN